MNANLPPEPDPGELPQPVVRNARRQISLVWLVPIVAALIGGWLVYKALTEKGPEITITFKSAEGLEAGKTKISYKDVQIGQVKEIRIGENLKEVVVKAELSKEAERFLTENTRFWVVRARLSASAVYGLGTVFSGAYIDIDPGKPGKPARRFTGLEEPPIVTTGLPGRHFTLVSERRGSIEMGAPVYYRQIRVGEVVAFHLDEKGKQIETKIFVHAPYQKYVRKNTRFWNASGLDVKLDAKGIKVDTESFVSMLVGGIAFDILEGNGTPGEDTEDFETFTLFENLESAREKVYPIRTLYVLYFNESVRGLSPGAPVEFRGIPIGRVVEVNLEFDMQKQVFQIPVIVATEPERIFTMGEFPDGMAREKLTEFLVEKGLRAQLRTGSLLTGQQYVALDMFPNAKPARVVQRGKYPEIPTVPTQIEEIGAKLTQLVNKLEKVPVEQIGNDLRDTIRSTNRLVSSPEVTEALKALNATIRELQQLTADLRTRVAPETQAVLEQARRSLATADDALRPDSPLRYQLKETLEELGTAARSLRALTDYLERHPEALLRGKGKEPTP
jgi:paraquat-inducible protein B